MTHNLINKLCSVRIGLTLILALFMAVTSWAKTEPISYIDENGDEKFLEPGSYTLLDTLLGGEYGQPGDNGVISLPGGWYVVSNDMRTDDPVDFAGDVQLVILDGVTVYVTNDNTQNKFTGAGNFTVYGQKDGSGVLNIDVFDVRKTLTLNNIQISSNTAIQLGSDYSLVFNGGSLNAASITGNVELRWNKSTDFVLVGTFESSSGSFVAIDENTPFVEEGDREVYRGHIEAKQNESGDYSSPLDGKMLRPCYTLTLVLPDGSVLSTEIASFDKNGDAWAEVRYLERSGIKFLGWYTMPDGETEVEMGSISITRNTTLYAKLGVEYVDKNSETKLATQFTVLNDVLEKLNGPGNTEYELDENGELNLPGGTYVVLPDGEGAKVEFANPINFSGNVLLIAADGAEMSVLDKKKVTVNGNLDIYGQKEGSGKLNVDNLQAHDVSINKVHLASEGSIKTYKVYVYGGSLDINILSGYVTLGWSDLNNSIKVEEYVRPSSSTSTEIADDKAFVDENGQLYSGKVEHIIKAGALVSPLDGKKLTPSYAVAFDLRDGNPANIVAATFDEELNGFVVGQPPEDPVRDGAEFLGWYMADGDELVDWSKPVVIAQNTTIYAKWRMKPVKYVDANGETKVIEDYIALSNGMTLPYDEKHKKYSLSGGWYVVPNSNPDGVDLSLEEGIIFNGDAHLILEDGAEMNLTKGRTFEELFNSEAICAVQAQSGSESGYSLSIYAGSFAVGDASPVVGSGILSAEGVVGYNVTLNGGHVNASIVAYQDKVAINGGVTEISAIMGDRVGVVLDWHSFEDRITVDYYSLFKPVPLAIAEGKYFKDEDGNVYSGAIELDQNGGTVLDGKTLIPTLSLGDENIVVSDIPRQVLAESAPCPEVVVKDGEKTLEVNKDYLAECVDNEAASATAPYVKITGTGIYAGEIKKHFEIWEKVAEYAAIGIYKDGDNKLRAVIDGNFSGELAEVLTEDVKVESVEFNREFPKNAYSTVVLPFDVNTNDLEGVLKVLAFDGLTVDEKGQKAAGMKEVWLAETSTEHVDLKAYTPYIMMMSGENLVIKSSVTLKKMEESVAVVDGWALRGTLEYKKWEENDPEIGIVYGFAAGNNEDLGVKVGDFVKVAAGAWINPMRAYLIKVLPKKVVAHGAYVTPVPGITEELPDRMSIVIVKGDKNGEDVHTTVIGQFNTRASEFRMNFVPRTYDLKGRSVGEGRKARGVYLKK